MTRMNPGTVNESERSAGYRKRPGNNVTGRLFLPAGRDINGR